MVIIFDIWVLNPQPEGGYSPEEELIFKTIHDFVYDRIVFMCDEITKEEDENTGKSPCIMIELIKKRLSFNGYSPRLTQKLKGCFNENDSVILGQRFDEAFSHFN